MTTESVDTLLAEIARMGLQLHNLFQLENTGLWRGNVRTKERHCYAFGEGTTSAQALREALAKVSAQVKIESPPEPPAVVVPRKGGVKIVRRSA